MEKAVTEAAAHSAALRGEPIEKYGLKLWGISMGRYEEWARCKKVWFTRQSTFPVFCISMTFLEALYTLDINAIENAGEPVGYIGMILYGLGMALRLNSDCVDVGDIFLSIDEKSKKLKSIVIKQEGGKESIEITPRQFNEIREIVAWMQGDAVPDESENDELLETALDLSERNTPPMNYDLLDMEASVALAYGIRIRELFDWTILEFERARRAIDRSKKHLICGIGATNGCKWEDGGNPYPSWCFDRKITESSALIAQSKFGQAKVNKKE